MSDPERRRHAASFSAVAGVYAAVRPGCPQRLADVVAVLDTHPELSGQESFELPYVTFACRYTLDVA